MSLHTDHRLQGSLKFKVDEEIKVDKGVELDVKGFRS